MNKKPDIDGVIRDTKLRSQIVSIIMVLLIRIARKAKGYNQAQIARVLGVQQSAVSRIERSEVSMTLHGFLSVCYLLELHPAKVYEQSFNLAIEISKTLSTEFIQSEKFDDVVNHIEKQVVLITSAQLVPDFAMGEATGKSSEKRLKKAAQEYSGNTIVGNSSGPHARRYRDSILGDTAAPRVDDRDLKDIDSLDSFDSFDEVNANLPVPDFARMQADALSMLDRMDEDEDEDEAESLKSELEELELALSEIEHIEDDEDDDSDPDDYE
jgi:transcriptional regulator with XRE-family HTH domain